MILYVYNFLGCYLFCNQETFGMLPTEHKRCWFSMWMSGWRTVDRTAGHQVLDREPNECIFPCHSNLNHQKKLRFKMCEERQAGGVTLYVTTLMSNNRNVIVMGKASHVPSSITFEGLVAESFGKKCCPSACTASGPWTSMGYHSLQNPVRCQSMEECDDFSYPRSLYFGSFLCYQLLFKSYVDIVSLSLI